MWFLCSELFWIERPAELNETTMEQETVDRLIHGALEITTSSFLLIVPYLTTLYQRPPTHPLCIPRPLQSSFLAVTPIGHSLGSLLETQKAYHGNGLYNRLGIVQHCDVCTRTYISVHAERAHSFKIGKSFRTSKHSLGTQRLVNGKGYWKKTLVK